MASSPVYASLRILFVNSPKNERKDDSLRVVPIWNPNATLESQTYKVTFKYDKTVMESTVEGGNYLVDYLQSILTLVSNDDEPCELVQFEIPNVPTVMIDHLSLDDRIPEVVDILEHLIHAWPTLQTERKPPSPLTVSIPSFHWTSESFTTPSRVRRHLRFDDEGNEVVDLTLDDEL